MRLDHTRVLLVEDNPADARFLREQIADVGAGGIKLTHVSRLEEALKKLDDDDFDIVLLDLSLPDESGIDTLVRAHAHAPGVPIVVLTGTDDEALAIRAVREGAQDYLVKGRTDGNLLLRAMRYASERKHAIEALQRREEHFRSLIENALDLISIVGEDGTIRYASPSYERVLGYRADDLVGSSAFQFIHPDDIGEFAGAFGSGGSPSSIESRVRHKNGSWRVLESIGRNLTHVPGVQGIVINSRDVTERKTAEDALSEANNTLRAVIRTSPLAIYSVDLGGHVRSWNAAAHRMLGWQECELLGNPLPHLVDGETERFQQHLEQVAAGADAIFETRCRTRDRRILDVNLWSAQLRDGAGQVKGVVHMVADVTERKRLEEQLHHSLKMEAVGRLAGGVAHDFNNLLMIINGYSQMLLSGTAAGDPARSDLEEVVKAAERAADLTKQLLAFSRRQIVQPKLLDLNSLVLDLERMLQRVIGEDIHLITKLAVNLNSIIADPGHIEQVVLNMTVNARDAMPGGGKLILETSNVCLDEEYVRSHLTPEAGDYVMLAVTDNGVGIDAETRTHLFEPFFTTKERGKGTGLGLSTSYGIIKQNGGDIWVDSEPGQGTTFRIYLPVASHVPAAPQQRPETTVLLGDETVLLVEDEAGVRTILEAMLRRHGYRVLSCGSPDEALEICARHLDTIHLLVTDMIMPGMNGRQLSEKVVDLRPGIQVLYVSGYADSTQQEVVDSAMDYLQKPFTPEALALKVRELLSRPSASGLPAPGS
jgi:two-component system cell cycle sensor histidine kinase/response regulator CckA